MIALLATLCVLALALGPASARTGVDLSVATTVADWQCLTADHDVSYAMIRLYRSLGDVDKNSSTTIQNAFKTGVENVGGYMFPCVQSSAYAASHNVTCPSVADQLASTLDMLHQNGIGFVGEDNSASYAFLLNRMWLDIEDESPSKYFDVDPEVNKPFIQDFVDRLTTLNIQVGIYTTKTYWQNIMANVEGYSQYPLWYPRYDGVNSMDFFTPFAGWTECDIKQTAGDAGWCQLSQVDTDYSL